MRKIKRMNLSKTIFLLPAVLLVGVLPALASNESPGFSKAHLEILIKKSISRNFGGARIELMGAPRWVHGEPSDSTQGVTYLGEDGQGNAHISAGGSASSD